MYNLNLSHNRIQGLEIISPKFTQLKKIIQNPSFSDLPVPYCPLGRQIGLESGLLTLGSRVDQAPVLPGLAY